MSALLQTNGLHPARPEGATLVEKASVLQIINAFPQLETYADRMFVLSEFFPRVTGEVLSVGCEDYNRLDYLALAPGSHLTTVDSNPANAAFGSPHRHYVTDFLDLRDTLPHLKFKGIVLFGVLGEGSLDQFYNLDKRVSETLKEAFCLLDRGGELLVAPNCSTRRIPLGNRARFLFWWVRLRISAFREPKIEYKGSKFYPRNPVFLFRKEV